MKTNMLKSLGDFSEQEKRSQQEPHSSLPVWEAYMQCVVFVIMASELKLQGSQARLALPKYHVRSL